MCNKGHLLPPAIMRQKAGGEGEGGGGGVVLNKDSSYRTLSPEIQSCLFLDNLFYIPS